MKKVGIICDIYSGFKGQSLGLGQLIELVEFSFEGDTYTMPLFWLDSGELLYGCECWWYPLFKGVSEV